MASSASGEEVLTLENLVTVDTDIEPYVLSWPDASGTDGSIETFVLVVMRRQDGVMLAVPVDTIPQADLDAGLDGRDEVLGLSYVIEVPSVILDGGNINPTGEQVRLVLVDCSLDVLDRLRVPRAFEDIAYSFGLESQYALPEPGPLLESAGLWVESADPEQALVYYSAVDGMETGQADDQLSQPVQSPATGAPGTPRATVDGSGRLADSRRRAKAPPPLPGDGGRPGKRAEKQEKAKKPTTASLAASLQDLMVAIPKLNTQVQALATQQRQIENRLAAPVSAACPALVQPLSQSVPGAVVGPSVLAKHLNSPPRTATAPSPGFLHCPTMNQPQELLALEAERSLSAANPPGDNLARAVLAQSQALTSLVSQIAQGQSDPLVDLGSSSSTGIRGSAGRAKLQAELASQRGLFFASVMSSMSRRMNPTQPVEGTYQQMMDKGICGTKYLERFGGYGRHRDLGQVQFLVMQLMDYLQLENLSAARDSVALLAVMLEQAVMDNGRFDLASVLCLQDDIPSSVFVNRSPSAFSRSKSFSPLADQRWITTALAYLKELDTIQSKRLEIAGGAPAKAQPSQGGGGGGNAFPKSKASSKKKGKGKGSQNQQQAAGEETEET